MGFAIKVVTTAFCIGGILCGVSTIHDMFPKHSDNILKVFIRPMLG
jgi:hypothetical protein